MHSKSPQLLRTRLHLISAQIAPWVCMGVWYSDFWIISMGSRRLPSSVNKKRWPGPFCSRSNGRSRMNCRALCGLWSSSGSGVVFDLLVGLVFLPCREMLVGLRASSSLSSNSSRHSYSRWDIFCSAQIWSGLRVKCMSASAGVQCYGSWKSKCSCTVQANETRPRGWSRAQPSAHSTRATQCPGCCCFHQVGFHLLPTLYIIIQLRSLKSDPRCKTDALDQFRLHHCTCICVSPTTFVPLPATFVPLPATFVPLPATFVLLPAAFVPLPAAFVPLPAAFVPLPAAFVPLPGRQGPCKLRAPNKY